LVVCIFNLGVFLHWPNGPTRLKRDEISLVVGLKFYWVVLAKYRNTLRRTRRCDFEEILGCSGAFGWVDGRMKG
jgi:hypothetical protein